MEDRNLVRVEREGFKEEGETSEVMYHHTASYLRS